MSTEKAFRERDKMLMRGDDIGFSNLHQTYERFSNMTDGEQEAFLLELNAVGINCAEFIQAAAKHCREHDE